MFNAKKSKSLDENSLSYDCLHNPPLIDDLAVSSRLVMTTH